MAFSPDGQTLVTGIERRRAEFWDVAGGRAASSRRSSTSGRVYAVGLQSGRPDGADRQRGHDREALGRRTHRPLGVTLQHHGTVYAVGLPSSRRPGDPDRQRRPHGAGSGTPPPAVPWASRSSTRRVLAVAFSPDGRIFATGCGDGLARLWDAESGHPLGLPVRHRGPVRAVAFGPGPIDPLSPNGRGRTLLTGSEDRTVRLTDVPEPLTDPWDKILTAIQAENGMSLDEHGTAEFFTPVMFNKLR